jgi:hypothetical protein
MAQSKKEIDDELDKLYIEMSKAYKEYDDLVAKDPKGNEEIDKVRGKLEYLIRLNGLAGRYKEVQNLLFAYRDWCVKKGDPVLANKIDPLDMDSRITDFQIERRRRGYEE